MSSSGGPTINTQPSPSSSPPLTASSPTASASPTSLLSPQGRIQLRSTSALSRDRYSQVSDAREEERRRGEERDKRDREDRERKDRETQQQQQQHREREKESRDKDRDNRGGRERHDRGDRPRRDDGRHGRGGERDRVDRERKDRYDGSEDRRDRERQHDRDNRERDRGDRSAPSSSTSSFTARRSATSHSNNILRITPSSLAPSANNNNNPASTTPTTVASSPLDLSPAPQPPSVLSTSTGPHPLAHSWCLYFDRRTAKNKQLPPPTNSTAASTSYENSLQLVSTFDTAEQLLALLHYLVLPSALDFNSNYHLFRLGVRPIWEDESNEKGGKWSVDIHILAHMTWHSYATC